MLDEPVDPDYLSHLIDSFSGPNGDHAPETEDESLLAMLIAWPDFWAQDHGEAEWIAEPIIPAKRSVALFAPGGTGKSLLSLWICAKLATGTDPFAGTEREPINVLYLDYEMTNDDLAERLAQMGYDGVDMTHLHYALLPSLPGLDQPEGGKAVVRLAQLVDADLVVIDTFGRAVHGDENDADTVRSWYRWTGIHLKHDGRAFLRVDHAGKDITKGQRGTSAKNDDVDVVWQMTVKEDHTYALIAKKRRMGWIPESVKLELDDDDIMRFNLLGDIDVYPTGTAEMAATLDRLQIPNTASARQAARAVRDAGLRGRNEVIRSAQKYRVARSPSLHFVGDDTATQSAKARPNESGRAPLDEPLGAVLGAPDEIPANPLVDGFGRGVGRGGAHPSDATGAQCAPIKGAHVPSVTPEPVDNSPQDDVDPELWSGDF